MAQGGGGEAAARADTWRRVAVQSERRRPRLRRGKGIRELPYSISV